ncbi:MAG: hypothetical protein ACPGJV_13055 [Bacteriovoracaceae bacterium]
MNGIIKLVTILSLVQINVSYARSGDGGSGGGPKISAMQMIKQFVDSGSIQFKPNFELNKNIKFDKNSYFVKKENGTFAINPNKVQAINSDELYFGSNLENVFNLNNQAGWNIEFDDGSILYSDDL